MSTKFILKYIILYIHCVDLLMPSPTKLDFLFYDFSVIYYFFSKIIYENKYEKIKKIKTAVTVSKLPSKTA